MDVSETTFDADVLERSHQLPVVVDFWAAWCAPCRALGPILEQQVAEREGAVVLAKVDVDANAALAGTYAVRGIPAVKAFRNGHVVSEFVGALPPARVAAWLDELTKPSQKRALRSPQATTRRRWRRCSGKQSEPTRASGSSSSG